MTTKKFQRLRGSILVTDQNNNNNNNNTRRLSESTTVNNNDNTTVLKNTNDINNDIIFNSICSKKNKYKNDNNIKFLLQKLKKIEIKKEQ
jgi:hypothetical protein